MPEIITETTVGDLHRTAEWLGLKDHVLIDDDNSAWRDLFTSKTGQGALELLAFVLDLDHADALNVFRSMKDGATLVESTRHE